MAFLLLLLLSSLGFSHPAGGEEVAEVERVRREEEESRRGLKEEDCQDHGIGEKHVVEQAWKEV